MPKFWRKGHPPLTTRKAYRDHLEIACSTELREGLEALSYLEGDEGEKPRLIRVMLQRALEDRLLDMTPRDRKKYDQFLEIVKANTVIRRQKYMEAIRKKQDAGEPLSPWEKAFRL